MDKTNKEFENADKIWEKIKDIKLEMFALPNQIVQNFYKPINIEPSKLYLQETTQASSALPALELALSGKYNVERMERYISVSPITNKI